MKSKVFFSEDCLNDNPKNACYEQIQHNTVIFRTMNNTNRITIELAFYDNHSLFRSRPGPINIKPNLFSSLLTSLERLPAHIRSIHACIQFKILHTRGFKDSFFTVAFPSVGQLIPQFFRQKLAFIAPSQHTNTHINLYYRMKWHIKYLTLHHFHHTMWWVLFPPFLPIRRSVY